MRKSLHVARVVPVLVLTGLFILTLGTMLREVRAAPAAQTVGWLGSAWARRMPIIITNTGSTLTDYQVHIALAAPFEFSSAKPDGSDLRVTAADGTTELPFWIESWGTSSASLYVKIPSLVGSDTTPTVYLYYGNPAATSASNGSTTFDLFDDFETPFGNPLANAEAAQTTPTYVRIGGVDPGQVVHPDLVYTPTGWNGYKYWLVIEPFPGGNALYENPSILASNDGAAWIEPSGIVNPIVLTPTVQPIYDYMADGDILYDAASSQMWVYYLHQLVPQPGGGTLTNLNRKVSSDGINWGDPASQNLILTVTNYTLLSPAVLYDGSQYRMWSVRTNGANSGCASNDNSIEQRTSSDGVTWSDPATVNFTQPGYLPWHLDVISVPTKSEFWALVAAYPSATPDCDRTSLFFARSSDGLNWTTYNRAALRPGVGGATWDGGVIYRSTFLYDAATDMLRVWYSANTRLESNAVWHQGYTERNYTQFLGALSSPNGNGWVINTGNGDWAQSTAQVKRGTYSGQLVQYPGDDMFVTKTQPIATNFYQEWDLYDDMAPSGFKGAMVGTASAGSVGVGVFNSPQCQGECSAVYYVQRSYDNFYNVTSVPRSIGWHKFGVLIKPDDPSVTYFIDDVLVATRPVPDTGTRVDIVGVAAAPSSYNIDSLRVRKYASPPPVVTLSIPTAVGPNALTVETFRAQSTGEVVSPLLWLAALGLAGSALLVARTRRAR